jgi:hypothetical protein
MHLRITLLSAELCPHPSKILPFLSEFLNKRKRKSYNRNDVHYCKKNLQVARIVVKKSSKILLQLTASIEEVKPVQVNLMKNKGRLKQKKKHTHTHRYNNNNNNNNNKKAVKSQWSSVSTQAVEG